MAVAPLFVADMDTLRARLRLSGVPVSSDAVALLDAATLEVRAGFYRRLGGGRVATLVAFTSTDTPTTDNEILRTVAEAVEVKWVRRVLLRTLPVLFMDGSGNRDQVWNEEGAFRQMGAFDRAAEDRRLHNDIEQALDLLAGRTSVGSETSVRVTSIEEDGSRPWPGHTLSPLWPPESDE